MQWDRRNGVNEEDSWKIMSVTTHIGQWKTCNIPIDTPIGTPTKICAAPVKHYKHNDSLIRATIVLDAFVVLMCVVTDILLQVIRFEKYESKMKAHEH